MLREMERDRYDASGSQNDKRSHAENYHHFLFPPEFPLIETNDNLSPLQRLEFFERKLLQELKA